MNLFTRPLLKFKLKTLLNRIVLGSVVPVGSGGGGVGHAARVRPPSDCLRSLALQAGTVTNVHPRGFVSFEMLPQHTLGDLKDVEPHVRSP
jgi:hypothetical protein